MYDRSRVAGRHWPKNNNSAIANLSRSDKQDRSSHHYGLPSAIRIWKSNTPARSWNVSYMDKQNYVTCASFRFSPEQIRRQVNASDNRRKAGAPLSIWDSFVSPSLSFSSRCVITMSKRESPDTPEDVNNKKQKSEFAFAGGENFIDLAPEREAPFNEQRDKLGVKGSQVTIRNARQ